MKWIINIFLFFKKIFYHEEQIKMIDGSVTTETGDNKTNFLNSIKVNLVEKKRKRVETLTCVGDGLGIQKKIEY